MTKLKGNIYYGPNELPKGYNQCVSRGGIGAQRRNCRSPIPHACCCVCKHCKQSQHGEGRWCIFDFPFGRFNINNAPAISRASSSSVIFLNFLFVVGHPLAATFVRPNFVNFFPDFRFGNFAAFLLVGCCEGSNEYHTQSQCRTT